MSPWSFNLYMDGEQSEVNSLVCERYWCTWGKGIREWKCKLFADAVALVADSKET